MAYQFSDPFLRENGVSVLQAPWDPSIGLLTQAEAAVLPPPEDVRVLAEVLQGYLLRLQDGEDALRTGLRWSELVDPNVRIGIETVGKMVEELIGLRPKEAAYLVGVLSQVATQGDREALSDQDGRLKAAIRALLQPLASNGSSSVAVSDKGPRITATFGGPLAPIAHQYAQDLYRSKYPQNGNLSYGPVLGRQLVIDGMLETQVTPEMLTTRRTELFRNTIMAQSFYDRMCELRAEEEVVPDGVRSLVGLWEIMKSENNNGGPASLLGAIMARNHQIGFAISVLGVSLSVQVPWVDHLSRKILEAMTEAWSYQRRKPYGIYTTSRVDGNLLTNFVDHIRQRTVCGHYDCVIMIYRHTDKFMCLFDYDNITENIIFMSHGHCELTTEQLEGLPEGRVYQCYRGPDGEIKTGKELDIHGVSKRHKFLTFIRRGTRDGHALKGTMLPRLLSLPGVAAQLGRDPEDLGCWRHMISGRRPSKDDLETFLDASKIEVLAQLSLWYEFPNHFQMSSEPVTNESALPALTTALGHVEFAVPSDADSELKYRAVPRPLGTESAFVTVLAHQNHACWKRRILWAGPLGRNTPFWT